MPQNQWTIRGFTGGPTGADLVGLRIKRITDGYELVAPDNTPLASNNFGSLPFSFRGFKYDNSTWTVTVDKLTGTASGSWQNTDPSIEGEEGTWSAGAGTDTEEKTDDPANTKAVAGK